jgi:hypothetical protein
MSHGLSLEIFIPPTVDECVVISIGERCAMDGLDEEMTLSDALQWAFTVPDAIAQLVLLGIKWNVIPTGR